MKEIYGVVLPINIIIACFFKCLIVKLISFDFLLFTVAFLKYLLAKMHTFIQFVQLLNTIFRTLRRDQMMAIQFGNPRRKKINNYQRGHADFLCYFCYNLNYIKLLDDII